MEDLLPLITEPEIFLAEVVYKEAYIFTEVMALKQLILFVMLLIVL